MSWQALASLMGQGLTAWLALLAAAVAWRMFRDGPGLLDLMRSNQGGGVDPERVQAVAVFGLVAMTYLVRGVEAHAMPGLPTRLPDIPDSLVAILAASHAVFL